MCDKTSVNTIVEKPIKSIIIVREKAQHVPIFGLVLCKTVIIIYNIIYNKTYS